MSLKFNETVGRVMRKEPWRELTVSTYRRIQDAIRDGLYAEAADYVQYFNDEALVCKRLYDQWYAETLRYLGHKGMREEEIPGVVAGILKRVAPAGKTSWDRDAEWQQYVARKDALVSSLRSSSGGDSERFLEELRVVKEAWRVSHDVDVDMFLGLFDIVIDRFGEPAIGEMWEKHLIRDWFEKRYARFDVSKHAWRNSFELLVELSFEAMHGHLCGPKREGDVEYREYEDRVELEFDPCGSGGRAYRGEPLDGTGPRMEAPYRFKAIQGAYDFTWNKKGICTYCAHCCALTEKLPAVTFGYPVRVIDPPSYPREANAKCRYTIYKDPRSIPEHVYRRLGLVKPAADQPLGSAHGPFNGQPR